MGTVRDALQLPGMRRREEFLTAVTGNSVSKTAADTLAARRLSADPPGHNDGPAPT